MSRKILIIEKTGVIKELMVKVFDETDLFKKAGFKTAEGFERRGGWTMSNGVVVSLYGKITGRAGQENKYDFPPPMDKTLFFGSCVLIAEENSLKKSEWEGYYEELFGGFEDIGDEDSTESEDEDDEDDALPKTKSGYAKDGFIVDDDDDDDEESDDDDEEEDEPVLVIKKNVKKTKPLKEKPVRKGKPTVFEKIETDSIPEENLFLDCTSELVEETYE
jgi:hypothetical protein